jgi:hypothetical protein
VVKFLTTKHKENTMSKTEVYGVARTVLAAAGGILVGKGYIDSETAIALAGAVATIIAAVWSVKSKRKAIQD